MAVVSLILGAILVAVCPPVSAARNLVENPSFEECDEMGDPAHWSWWGSEMGELADAEVFQWEPEGYSGKWSVSIREECWGMRGWWSTIVRGIKPRRWYSVSVRAKRDRPTGWLPELQLFGREKVMNLYRVGVWEKFDWLVNSGEFHDDVVLKLINRRKPYKVWFDDVVVREFCVEADLDDKPGKLSWRSPETDCLVVFKVEAARSDRFENAAVIAETLNNEIPLPPELNDGKWYWRVRAFQSGVLLATSRPRELNIQKSEVGVTKGRPAAEEVLPPCRPESSEHISFDENLNLLVDRKTFSSRDGKPFFPIGIYSLPPEKFSEARRAGFNAVLTKEVEAARRAGLRAIVPRSFRYSAKSDGDGGGLSEEEVNRWIIARYLWDEPAQTNASPRDVFRAHKQEKTADPHHPTAIVVYRPENFLAYASASDILMTDPYPIPHRPMSVVPESVRAAVEAVGDLKPVWAVVQAFNWMDASQEARRTGWARWPTYQEERCMAYLAVISGARGILFYRYCGKNRQEPPNWGTLKRVASEMKDLSPILLSRTLALPVSLDVQAPSRPDGKHNNNIDLTVKSDGRRTFLIAANNWPGKRRATFSFQKELKPFVGVPFEKRRIRTEYRSFSDTFAPYGVHVYELRFK
ncbi:hypothetical protein HQ563_14925 [bacterium]|nr:hypothetical protein [bacterium]